MTEQFEVPVGTPEAPSMFSGAKGRYIILGGIGVAVAAAIILARKGIGTGAAAPAGENVAPGIDPAIAIGSLEQQVREQDALFSGLREDILGGFDTSARQVAGAQVDLSGLISGGFDASAAQVAGAQSSLSGLIAASGADVLAAIAASKADLLAHMGITLDGVGSLSQQIAAALSSLSAGQKQIFDRQWDINRQQAAANYQIFQRASNPNWMPSASDPVF